MRKFYIEVLKMYLSLFDSQEFLHAPLLGSFTITASRDSKIRRIAFIVSCYPCGRVKLVAPSAGYSITGDASNNFKSVVFDSVRSLYTVPGLSVITPPAVVYAACGRCSRRIEWRGLR